MAPGVGGAPRKGDPSGSPEAVPADACGWGRQEALQGPQAKARAGWGALPGGAGSQGRGMQAPLEKGRFRGFQHGCSPGDSTSPPKARPRSPWRPKGQDWVPPPHGQQREAWRGRPASCSRLHPENLRVPFLQGQRARPRWQVGEERQNGRRQAGKAAENLRRLTWARRHRQQHVRAAHPHARRGARAQLRGQRELAASACPGGPGC